MKEPKLLYTGFFFVKTNEKRQYITKSGFTLVELIVVITILAILGTIAFIALQGYSAQARDSKRLSDVSNIKKSLELFSLNTGKYPKPDDNFIVSYSGETLWYQGTVGDQVSTNLSKNLNEKPTDPTTGLEYTYSTTYSQTEYEVLSLYESDLMSFNSLMPFVASAKKGYGSTLILNTNAATLDYPKIDGNYNGIYIKTLNFYVPTPSLINAEIVSNTDIKDTTLLQSQIITGGDNIPLVSTGGLNINLSVYEGTITDSSTNEDKSNLVELLQTAYSGTLLSNNKIYADLLSRTTMEEKLDFVNIVVLNNAEYSNTLTGWRLLDSNCDIEDIHIPEGCVEGTEGCQIWAGCNSTLGDGFERGQTDDDIGTDNYSGIIKDGSELGDNDNLRGCYNYDGTGTTDCYIGENIMLSNFSAKSFFDLNQLDKSNINLDSEYNVIWGKLYTWTGAIYNACQDGRHVPSDNDWNILTTYLNGGIDCEEGDIGWLCSGLGWKGHKTKTNINNLANILKIPLVGYRRDDSLTFTRRGNNMFLWSSTTNESSAFIRALHYDYLSFYRGVFSKNYGFSVRCIKD